LPDQRLDDHDGGELVVISLPGVQRFVAEARSTSDVTGASGVFAQLAARAATVLHDQGGKLVFPSSTSVAVEGMPNRVVALFQVNTGAKAAEETCRRLRGEWEGWVRRALNLPGGQQVPETPAFPQIQWVCVPPGDGGYPGQWRQAQRLLAARRRVRDFSWVQWQQRSLCSLSPRWPAEDEERMPPGLPSYEQATLSAVGWVKHRWRHIHGLEGFPSTASIASAPFRREILHRLGDEHVRQAVADLKRAVEGLRSAAPAFGRDETPVHGLTNPGTQPGSWLVTTGGPWVYPDTWQVESLAREAKVTPDVLKPAVDDGLTAARRLRERMKELGVPAIAGYLAVVVQDLDGMGSFLGGEGENAAGTRLTVTPGNHRNVSRELQKLAGKQTEALRSGDLLGVPVYAGGDDLLAFTPALTALRAARRCHEAVPPELPRASTAVLFFHYHAGLQHAMSTARNMLEQAKERIPGKHGLAVGYLRRSGVGETSVQPWAGGPEGSSADAFGVFAVGGGRRLSPRLVADLDQARDELAALSRAAEKRYRAELARLVRRHTEGEGTPARGQAAKAAAALEWLGNNEAAEPPADQIPGSRPQLAARVAVFLRQEAR
jgi:CRISPR-associated protein Cmr2